MGRESRVNAAAGMTQTRMTNVLTCENDYLFALLRNIELKHKLNEMMPQEQVVEEKKSDLVIVRD